MKMCRWYAIVLLMAILLQTIGGMVFAQNALPQSVPQNVMPGALNSDLQKNIQRAPPDKPPDKGSKVDVAPGQAAQEDIQLPTFKLQEVLIKNATILDREDLAPLVSPIIGQEVTEKELLALTRSITAIYHEKGYKTSQAFLPSQRIQNGVVEILVLENRIAEIKVEGTKHVTPDWVLSQISLKKGDVLNIATLTVELNKIKQHPKIRNLVADVNPATGVTILKVDDMRSFHLINSVDNTGRETIGQIRYSNTMYTSDFLGLGHSAVLNYTGASGMHSVTGQYEVPLNQSGWRLGGRASISKTMIGGSFDFLKITGLGQSASLYSSFPILSGERMSLEGNLSYNAKFANIYYAGARQDSFEQNVHSLSSGLNWMSFDKFGRWIINQNTDLGFGAESKFLKFQGSAMRWLKLPKNMMLVLKSEGQVTKQNLPGMEQMQIGGFSTVRGYSEGFLIADYGFLLGSELHFPLWGLPDVIKNNVEGLLFAEGGNVYLSDKTDPTTRGVPGNIFSWGLGLRGRISRYLSGRLDVGFAQAIDETEPTARVHFGVTGNPF